MSEYVTLTCNGCGQTRRIQDRRSQNRAPRNKSDLCQPCARRKQVELRVVPPIKITPEIETWALIQSAWFTERDWFLLNHLPPYAPEAA